MRAVAGLLLSVCSIISLAKPAQAIEPLDVFLASARGRSFDNREALATLDQRSAEATAAWLKLIPVVTVTGSYTHNQYASVVTVPSAPPATVLAENQGDLIASATLPIIDVGQWERIGAAKATLESARSHASATSLDVDKVVTRDWYQVVAEEAVLDAARRTLETSEKNRSYVSNRKDAGVASELDFRRALAEVERNKQSVADAQYQVDVARITLSTASGHPPTAGGVALTDDLNAEAPLQEWLATNVDALPSVRAAIADVRSYEKQASATRAGLLPTLSASGSEHVTNAPRFGQSPYYTVGATLTWRFDASVIPSTSAAYDQAAGAKVRADKARQLARDDIHTAWLDVERQIEKVRAARAQLVASTLAARVAKERYDAGTANFLDVLAADRDAFSAEVSRIQADTDLAYARVVLRINSGRTVRGGRS